MNTLIQNPAAGVRLCPVAGSREEGRSAERECRTRNKEYPTPRDRETAGSTGPAVFSLDLGHSLFLVRHSRSALLPCPPGFECSTRQHLPDNESGGLPSAVFPV